MKIANNDNKNKINNISPIDESNILNVNTLDNYDELYQIGLQSIKDRKVAALIMAGGQGSRFGMPIDKSKGLYEIGPFSGHTFLQRLSLQIFRLWEISGGEYPPLLLILTNDDNNDSTCKYFKDNNYFGLNNKVMQDSNVLFFKQNNMPALDHNYNILLKNKYDVNLAPDGNGSIY